MRISRNEVLMEAARLAARRSTCLRLQVGAILERRGRIVVWGYGGAPAGRPHCNPTNCGPDRPCTRTVHAEANCLYFAARHGIETDGTVMWTTDSPCRICAEGIINAGIVAVIYDREYRDQEPLMMLRDAGLVVTKYASQS